MQRELTGRVPIRVRYDLKPEQKDKTSQIAVEPLRVLDAPGKTDASPRIAPAAVSGEITVQKDRSLSVSAKADDGGDALEPIDVRELTLLAQDGNLAFRYFKQPSKLSDPFKLGLTATRHEIQEVVETVVAQALVELVVTEDKVATYRCRYRLKTSERQRLAVELPKDAEVLDTFVGGKRADLEKDASRQPGKDREAFTINVARATPSDQPFVLSIVFRVPFKENPLRGSGGNLALPFPRLGGAAREGHATVALQQLRVAAWVPKDFVLVGAPRDFTPQQPTRLHLWSGAVGFSTSTAPLETWFGDTSGPGATGFAFTPSGRAYTYERLGPADTIEVSYWKTSWFTWWISGTLLVIALILAYTSWENRLSIILLVAFGCAMYALYDADQVLNGVAAARWGILAMLVFWFIHALNRPKPRPGAIGENPADPMTAVPTLGAATPPPETGPATPGAPTERM
jgi:hypothetical protein